jgi:environmental stress-induced protein Ves
MRWKNGLGETTEMAIRPEGGEPNPGVNFAKDAFLWRLSSSEVKDSCNYSIMPGYDVSLIPLPNEWETPIDLFHDGKADCEHVYPLVPYTCNFI